MRSARGAVTGDVFVLDQPAEEVDSLQEQIFGEEIEGKWEDFKGFDLSSVDISRPIRWVPGAEEIIRRGERQTWGAAEGEGKTESAVILAGQTTAAGARVLYLDCENDKIEMAGRFQPVFEALGGKWDKLKYLPNVKVQSVPEEILGALEVADLIVIDSLTRILGQLGLDENANKDIATWTTGFVDEMATLGAAVLVLDNFGHDGKHNRGAISKTALVEAAYTVTGGKGVRPDQHGELKLKLTRSRSGRIARCITAGAGGGVFTPLVVQPGEAPSSGARVERLQALERALSESADRDYSIKELKHDFPDDFFVEDKVIRSALKGLTDAERLEETVTAKPGKAGRWRWRP